MARRQTGTLVWQKSSWYGRYWRTIDGVRTRVFVALDTQNEILARKRLDALIDAEERGGAADTGPETFEQAAVRVYELRARTIEDTAELQIGWLRKHAFDAVGRIPVVSLTKADILSVLERVRDAGYSDQWLLHGRNAFSAVYKQLRREGVVDALPVPSADELPECLPEAIDDRPKAILSDAEMLIFLGYTDPRKGERFRGAVRERQMMVLFSRCVGGMRTGELQGLTFARAAVEGEAFDRLEVIRYKTRRKGGRRGSKAAVRQLYPLGDTVLPLFLRFWWLRSGRPPGEALLFPIRRPRRAGDGATRGAGEQRVSSTWARALRRDVASAFKDAHARNVAGVPAPGSPRWNDLLQGSDDRQRLIFHSTRNMAAVAIEKFERLKSSARFTGHATGRMLQHYRERAGEVDVVPVAPEFMPDAAALLAVLRSWCEADGIDPALVFGVAASSQHTPNELADGTGKWTESPCISVVHTLSDEPESCVKSRNDEAFAGLEGRCSIQLSYGGRAGTTGRARGAT